MRVIFFFFFFLISISKFIFGSVYFGTPIAMQRNMPTPHACSIKQIQLVEAPIGLTMMLSYVGCLARLP
jgi:hypothetical protein